MKRIDVNGTTLCVDDQGTGPPLVLLHGFPLNHAMWRAQIEALSGDRRVLAPDLRGHGQSDVTPGTVTMPQMADDVARILDALSVDQPVALCGLSMGGYVAWEFWRRHRPRLESLIVCDTRAAGDTAEVAKGRDMMAARIATEGPELAAEAMLPKLFAQHSYSQRPELIEQVRQMMLSTDPQAIAATQRGMARRDDMAAYLPDIDVPTLVLCGEDDRISPADEMRGIADAIPQARFVLVASAGHMAPMEQPAVVNEAIASFLAG